MRRALIIPIATLGIATVVTIVTIVGTGQPAPRQGLPAGQRVSLVARDLDIPAHAAPGDAPVPFRFRGGSFARILSVDEDSGWVQLRGERADGEEAVGWVVPRYIQTIPTADEPPTAGDLTRELQWCPAKGSPNPPADGRLRLATWNLENLHAQDGQATYGPPRPSVTRRTLDYRRIRCYVRLIDPDVIAVQEIDGANALGRVVDRDVYNLHVSDRARAPNMNGRQNTGFAYKKGLDVTELPDFDALDVSHGGLRYGTRMSVSYGQARLQLMSVHLKSGCFANTSTGPDCVRLGRQIPVLEEWIDRQSIGPDPFIVLGDFNRRLNEPGDTIWADLDDHQPASADLAAATEGRPVDCRDNRFATFVDHIVFGARSIDFVDRSSFRQVNFRPTDRPFWDVLSDHCPLVVELVAP